MFDYKEEKQALERQLMENKGKKETLIKMVNDLTADILRIEGAINFINGREKIESKEKK